MKPGRAVNFGSLFQWKYGIRASVQLAVAFGLWSSSIGLNHCYFLYYFWSSKACSHWKYASLELSSDWCDGIPGQTQVSSRILWPGLLILRTGGTAPQPWHFSSTLSRRVRKRVVFGVKIQEFGVLWWQLRELQLAKAGVTLRTQFVTQANWTCAPARALVVLSALHCKYF